MTTTTLPTVYQEFIALSRYARFDNSLGRREKWGETVDRLIAFWRKQVPMLTEVELQELGDGVRNLEAMPSMRTLMTAGKALERDHTSGFNCSYAAVTGSGPSVDLWDSKLGDLGFDEPISIKLRLPIVFDELFYLLLCGTGTGFSVERQFVSEMPTVGNTLSRSIYKRTKANFPGVDKQELSFFDKKQNTIYVADSKYGWASALRILIVELYNANFSIKYDISEIRPAGAILKTFGGRASGPEALVALFEYTKKLFQGAAGRKLTSLECHDLVCMIGMSVVVGGVRRSATLSLSNLSDERMRYAKSGSWWEDNSQRAMANNSVAYTEKPSVGAFMREWQALYESKSGERGIFNRAATKKAARAIGREYNHDFGTNPCGEISLRNKELCNLTEVVIRPDDSFETLKEKVRLTTIFGTLQSTLTNFVYLSEEWKKNCDEERLLGVSMTGALDHPVLSVVSEEARTWLRQLRAYAKEVNKEWAAKLGIPASAAITCSKPSGTLSQLVDSASGLHPRYSPYYIRRVRADVKDPLAQTMQAQGYPCEIADGQPSTLVFSFPIKAPEHAVFRDDRTAIEQLEYWMMWKTEWTDHNPSITIYVTENEWFSVGAWVYDNFDDVGGLSFLPHSDHIYRQAPYEEITEEQYNNLLSRMPSGIDYEALGKLETTDHTTGTQEYACTAGGCELI